MKKSYKSILAGILLLFGANSCSDYLDQVPSDILSLERVFETRESSMKYLSSVYTFMPDEFEQRWTASGSSSQGTSGAWIAGCDEAEYVWDFVGSQTINNGSLTPETGFVYTYWEKWYRGIRTATLFIDNLHLCTTLRPGDFEQWTAEARAARAIYYYYLLRTFGPIPLIKEPMSEQTNLAELQLPRNSVEEVVEYILTELDEAMKNGLIHNIKLGNPGSSDKGLGHIDQAIAKTFKIQTRMLAASHLFNGSNTYFSDLANPDGTKLFPTYTDDQKKALWAAAAKEAKEFIQTFVGNGYDLTRKFTSDGKLDPYLSYREAIRGYRSELTSFGSGVGGATTSAAEMIWFRERTNASTQQYERTPKHFGMNDYVRCSGGMAATQEIVDSYFMANGLKPITGYESDNKTPKINKASGYVDEGFSTEDYKDPVTGRVFAPKGVHKSWTNREPRFYADITFDGQKWLYTGQGDVFTGLQKNGNSGIGSGNSNDYAKTGYIVRKSAPLDNWGSSDRVCIMIRLAQIYLDYAEALQESNPGDPDILKYVNLIRERAGIPQYGSGAGQIPVPADMRQAIRDERRVELAFENSRYFDVRRWGIAEQFENKPIHGMNINENGDKFFVRTEVEARVFTKKNYFFPIPNKDININKNLVQNKGWE